MDFDSWISTRLSNSSRRHHSRSDLFLGSHEDIGGDDHLRAEFTCPFCAEDYDVVGLCCHIDEEHRVEADNGVCPVCAKKVGMGLISHITTQHGNILKVQRKRRYRKGGSNSTFSVLRRELKEGTLQSLLGDSSYIGSSNSEADPLLSLFIYNPVVTDENVSSQPRSSVEATVTKEILNDDFLERNPQQLPLSDKDRVEKARQFEFVQGLLMSTILDDNFIMKF